MFFEPLQEEVKKYFFSVYDSQYNVSLLKMFSHVILTPSLM